MFFYAREWGEKWIKNSCANEREREREKSSLPTTITVKIELYCKRTKRLERQGYRWIREARQTVVLRRTEEVNVHLLAQHVRIFKSSFISEWKRMIRTEHPPNRRRKKNNSRIPIATHLAGLHLHSSQATKSVHLHNRRSGFSNSTNFWISIFVICISIALYN